MCWSIEYQALCCALGGACSVCSSQYKWMCCTWLYLGKHRLLLHRCLLARGIMAKMCHFCVLGRNSVHTPVSKHPHQHSLVLVAAYDSCGSLGAGKSRGFCASAHRSCQRSYAWDLKTSGLCSKIKNKLAGDPYFQLYPNNSLQDFPAVLIIDWASDLTQPRA